MSMATGFSVIGLLLDIVGAYVLVRGVLSRDMATLRAIRLVVPSPQGSWVRLLALKAAFLFGSKDIKKSEPDFAGAYADMFWGLILLGLGFVGQLLGQVLAK